MAIFSKKNADSKAASPEKKQTVKKEAGKSTHVKKNVPVKDKKVRKPKKDAGANLTKAPVRIIKTPRITEKAVQMTMQNAYVFDVAMDATKRDVVAAVQALYGITPRKVNMVRKNSRAYVARFRNRRGKKAGVKKAYIFLKKGEKIDIA